jgi:hypothetical protein
MNEERETGRKPLRIYDPNDLIIQAMLKSGLEDLITNGFISLPDFYEEDELQKQINDPFKLNEMHSPPKLENDILYVHKFLIFLLFTVIFLNFNLLLCGLFHRLFYP